jgi:hypothetical protein
MHFSPTKVEQFTFIIEIKVDSQQHHFQFTVRTKLEEVFLYYFIDPIADFWNFEQYKDQDTLVR